MPVRVCCNQAGIRREALTADQSLGEAATDDAFKKTPKDIAVPETSVPVA